MSEPGLEDRRLASAVCANGDEAAFRTLYRRHTPSLFRLALRLGGGDEAWAEELVQRSWIRAVQGLDRFRWRSTLRTWLTGIMVNCARELWRERRDDLGIPGDSLAGPADSPEERIDLERAVTRLPQGCRRIFVLHDVEGFTHQEIAELLGVEVGTSKSQLAHARRRLRAALAPSGVEPKENP